jgi:hypothetical protein
LRVGHTWSEKWEILKDYVTREVSEDTSMKQNKITALMNMIIS